MLEANERLLEALEGFYAVGDCGAYLSIAKITKDKFLWCFWNRKDATHDEEKRITHPTDYGYEESYKVAKSKGWKSLKENRPPEYREYYITGRWGNDDEAYLYKTGDSLDGTNFHRHGFARRENSSRGEAAWEFHRRLIAERKLKRKRKVGEGQEVEFVYVHYTYTQEDFDRTSARYRRRRVNLKYAGWYDWKRIYKSNKSKRHKTDQYRTVQKTGRYIYLQGEPVTANDFESFQDYRDHQAKRFRLDRADFDATGMVYHGRLGWITKDPVHPESAVPDTVSALLDLDCFTLLGINTVCSDAEVKKAFRKLVKGIHPDSTEMRGKPAEEFKEATLKFMALQKARDEAISRLKKHKERKPRKGEKP
jgi:DnaJ-domain-containing protein 1